MFSTKIHTKWIIGRIIEHFSYLALVEYRTKWICIKWGPGVSSWIFSSLTDLILTDQLNCLMPITSRPFGFSNLPSTLWNENATSKTISSHCEAEVHLFPAIADNAVCCSHCSINKHCFAKNRISLISTFSSLGHETYFVEVTYTYII